MLAQAANWVTVLSAWLGLIPPGLFEEEIKAGALRSGSLDPGSANSQLCDLKQVA